MNRPRWLDDETEIKQLLNGLLDKLDKQPLAERKQALRVKVDKKILPALFRHDEQSDHEWAMLKSLSETWSLFEIKQSRKAGPYDAEFANAALVFNPEAESMLRQWLQRPQQLPYPQQWRNAVSQHANSFNDQGEALATRPARINGKSAEQIVTSFANLAQLIDKGLSLRQLSARCFWGHSKFLDNREALLKTLFIHANIRPRPIMVNTCLPQTIQSVLFIENHDTYINTIQNNIDISQHIDLNLNHFALVYLSGFQGSAKRIREPSGVSLHFHATSKTAAQSRFEAWWFEKNNETWQSFFWGDLDYSGMAILKTLRQRFTNTEAWQPGYEIMLQQLNTGQGHEANVASKEEQRDPGQTGCHYADQILLPALRKTAMFVDQEWV